MKLMIAVILGAASLVQAGQENQGVGMSPYRPSAIYKALSVEAVNLNPGIVGSSRLQKSVGGLSCVKETIIVPHAVPHYSCDVDQSQQDFGAIYEALNVKAVRLNPGIAGVSRLQKSVGGLVCEKTLLVVPDAKPGYQCTIINE